MFHLKADYSVTPGQKKAVDKIICRFTEGHKRQVLLGVTGSGKTFAVANIIRELNVPTLILSPNKTLAAQLYQEFREFFPANRVGYFISYYDYYQPEAYVPRRNLYIAKEVSINRELERLRIDAARSILESRATVIVASVSAIYSIGSPDDFYRQRRTYSRGQGILRDNFLRELIKLGYLRTEDIIESGEVRVRGQALEVFPSSGENPLRFIIESDEIAEIEVFDSYTGDVSESLESVSIFPVSYFHYQEERIRRATELIRGELMQRMDYFEKRGESGYARRLSERTLFDLEKLTQFGHCQGVENYSLYLSGRSCGQPPFTLLDFFGSDYLVVMDESHIAVPQLHGMYEGDRSRKQKLVDFGFRLPSALENRPLKPEEIARKLDRVLYVSATPAEFELRDSRSMVTELLTRPTGLLDPEIELRRSEKPVEDLLTEIKKETRAGNRVLVTTLTKKMAEKLTAYLGQKGVACTYLHSEIKPLDRIKIIQKLRSGAIEVLVGINLLREGLDLPEVTLVAILDADREGFLRSERALIQTFGRAARNISGRVVLYIHDISDSIRRAMAESSRRREFQKNYNNEMNIVPRSISRKIRDFHNDSYWIEKSELQDLKMITGSESLKKMIEKTEKEMKVRAAALDFRKAAELRDRLKKLKNMQLDMF